MTDNLQIERITAGSMTPDLVAEWEELLPRSVRPTIFATFDYIEISLRHLVRDREVFFLLMRAADSGSLLAVFPLSFCMRKIHGVKLRVLSHALPPPTTEVDKPCPVIHREAEEACWRRFRDYLRNECRQWDLLELDELVAESFFPARAESLFPFPSFRTRVKPGPDSPIIRLDGQWEDFWGRHRKLRKRSGRLERGIPALSYRITNDPEEVMQCLQEYMETEKRSWKQGEMVAHHRTFYEELIPRLAAKGRVWFGMMRDGGKTVSIEVAFTFCNTVYFCHGTYAPEYADYSPGMVNSAWFIRHFHGRGFCEGDYLAGFAEYVNPWAYRIERSQHVTVRKTGLKTGYLAAWHLLGKLKRRLNAARRVHEQ